MLLQLQEADLSERGHGGPRMLLALEVDLDGEPVGDRRPLGQALQGAPHSTRVQELPLAPVELGRGGAEEAVQEGGELGAGEEAGAVLEIEQEAVGRRPVQREQQRPGRRGRGCGGRGREGRGSGGGWLTQVRNIVRYGQRGDRVD